MRINASLTDDLLKKIDDAASEQNKSRSRFIREAGARVYLPRRSVDYAVEVGLRHLVLRHLVLRDGGSIRAAPGEMILLRYYANSIAHLRGREIPRG